MYFKNVYSQLKLANILIFFSIFIAAASLKAQVRIGLDISSLQENRSSTQLSSVGRTLYDGYLNVSFKKEHPVYLTLGYLGVDTVENYEDATYTGLSATNAYVGVTYHFFHKESAGLLTSISYAPYAQLTVSEKTGSESWNGTTIFGKVSGTFKIDKYVRFNAGIYYINETFTHRASGNVTTKSSFTKSYLMPSIGLAYAF